MPDWHQCRILIESNDPMGHWVNASSFLLQRKSRKETDCVLGVWMEERTEDRRTSQCSEILGS